MCFQEHNLGIPNKDQESRGVSLERGSNPARGEENQAPIVRACPGSGSRAAGPALLPGDDSTDVDVV